MQTTERISSVSGVWEVVRRQNDATKPPPALPPLASSSPSTSSSSMGQQEEEEEEENTRGGGGGGYKMGLEDWLLLIPDYDGSPDKFGRFADSIRYVCSHLCSNSRILLLALGTKLRCRARTLFQDKLHEYKSIDEFLNELHRYFGGLGTECALLDQLSKTRQGESESLLDYAIRLDRLSRCIRPIYEEDRSSELEVRRAHIRFLQRMASTSFRRGLRSSELEIRVAAYDPKSLDEAIPLAIALDNQLSYRDKLIERQLPFPNRRRRY